MVRVPKMRDVMTPHPHTVGLFETVRDAQQTMLEHGIRHLPVRDGGKVVGIVSDRDVTFAVAMEEKYDFELSIEDIYLPNPVIVSPDAPVAEVARIMAERRIGSVLVAEDHQVQGIYTTVDVCEDYARTLTEG